MTEVFRFTVLGLGAGGLYSLAAIGMVLVYRGSRVINFAQAAMGMVGAYAYYEMRVVRGLPAPVALLVGLATSGAAGALFHVLVMRRMRESSLLARVVATLALLVVLQGSSTLIYGPLPKVVPSMLPTGPVRVLGAFVGADRLWIFGVVMTLTAVLWAVYRWTRFGVATSAVAENPRAAAALAISPQVIAAVNWAVGAALGGLAVILLVPITGLGTDNITLLVIPVLAAAVVGRFSSFPLTTLTGLLIGVAQSLTTRYSDSPGYATAIPFLFVAVVLLGRGRAAVGKAERFGRMPALGRGRPSVSLVAGCVAAGLALIWFVLSDRWVESFMVQLLLAIVLLSFVVVTGFAGQLSLAQMTFGIVGALGTSWLMFHHGWPLAAALVGAAVLSAPVGMLVGLAGLRARGMNLAIVTLGFAIAFEAVVLGDRRIMRRVLGLRGDHLYLFGIDVSAPAHTRRYATVALVVLVLLSLAVLNLHRSRAGRRLIAVRTNERAAAALGVSVLGAKLYAFVLGGAIAGIGGALLSLRTRFLSLGGFGSFSSILALQYAVFGGVGSVGGPLVGSAVSPDSIGPRFLGFLGNNAATTLAVVVNLAILVMLAVAPDGVVLGFGRALRAGRARFTRSEAREGRRERSVRVPDGDADRGRRVAPQTLEMEHVTVRFGGTVALDDVSLVVHPGEVVGLIGPNGAGKSTAIEAITGFVEPQQGTVRVGGATVDGWRRERRARHGLSRTFQSLELFEDLTARENLLAAADRRDAAAYVTNLVRPGSSRLSGPVAAVAADFGLSEVLESEVGALSYAERRMLAVARAVAGGQSVLLLDEPAAGLDRAQTRRLTDVIGRLARERGVAVLLVEHNVAMVLRTCDRVYALDFGRVIGHGTAAEIRANTAVIESYLGVR